MRQEKLEGQGNGMLIVFGGLPGTGKTTIARKLAERIPAVYLRIDSIEQAIVNAGAIAMDEMGPAGYMAAYALAADNLRLGLTVIADSVNPLKMTRDDWYQVGVKAGSKILEVEIICSDINEHRRRVEGRVADIPNLVLPDWQKVLDREYHLWHREHLMVDTAHIRPDEAVDIILKNLYDQSI